MIIVFIEGNVGVGKSSLLDGLRSRGVAHCVVAEPVCAWTEHLHGVYEASQDSDGPNKWALPMQMLTECTRMEALLRAIRGVKAHGDVGSMPANGSVVVVERSTTSAGIFGKLILNPDEQHAFGMVQECNKAILHERLQGARATTVYMRAPPSICIARTSSRARLGEEHISPQFLHDLHDAHEETFLLHGGADIVVNCGDKHCGQVVDAVEKFIAACVGAENLSQLKGDGP